MFIENIHGKKILPNNWRIVSITELGRDCFTLEGKEYHVPVSFFIFDKSEGKDLRVNPNAYTELMILNSPIKIILTYLYLVLLQEELQKLRHQTIEDTSLSQKFQ